MTDSDDAQLDLRSLIDEGTAHLESNDFDNAERCFVIAIRAAQEADDNLVEGLAILELGGLWLVSGEFRRAVDTLNRVVEIAHELDNYKMEYPAVIGLGYAYRRLEESIPAIKAYVRSIAVARLLSKPDFEALALTNLGIVYLRSLNDPETAIKFHHQALHIAIEAENYAVASPILQMLGNSYVKLGDMRTAIDYYERALVVFASLDDSEQHQQILLTRVLLFYAQFRAWRILAAFLSLGRLLLQLTTKKK